MLARLWSRGVFLLACAALGFAADGTALAAEGVNLSWNHCYGEGTGTQNATFACNVNSGVSAMVGSFVLGSDLGQVIGTEIVVDLATASAALPPWWSLQNPGGCRAGSLTANFIPEATNVVCQDWTQGYGAIGGIGAYCTLAGPCVDHPLIPNAARIKLVDAVPQEAAQDVTANLEYFAFSLRISHARTVGTGSCGGCDVPVCIMLTSINVVPKGTIGERLLTTAASAGSQFIAWQGGGVPVNGIAGCPAVTTARHPTWGSVKALYR